MELRVESTHGAQRAELTAALSEARASAARQRASTGAQGAAPATVASPPAAPGTAPANDMASVDQHPVYGEAQRLRARLSVVHETQDAAQTGLTLLARADGSIRELQGILADLERLSGDAAPFRSEVVRMQSEIQRILNRIRYPSTTSVDGSALAEAMQGDLETSLDGQAEVLGAHPPAGPEAARDLVGQVRSALASTIGSSSRTAIDVHRLEASDELSTLLAA